MNDKPTSFFKYYSVEGAIATLCCETRRWTKPSAFNDPFDNQIQQRLRELSTENFYKHDFTPETIEELLDKIRSSTQISTSQYLENALPEWKNFHQQQQDKYHLNPIEFSDTQFERELNEFASTNPKIVKVLIEAVNANNYKFVKLLNPNNYNDSHFIFCISEIKNSILMWSHYAQNHKGAVIEFLPNHELSKLRKVNYLSDIPELDYPDAHKTEKDFWDIFDTNLIFSKAICWIYEQEWRSIYIKYNNPSYYMDLPFEPKEIASIYLGCRINKKDRNDIIRIASKKYPSAKIFQMKTKPDKYELDFDRIYYL